LRDRALTDDALFKTAAAWLRSHKVELGLGVRVTVAAMARW